MHPGPRSSLGNHTSTQPLISEAPFQSTGVFLVPLAQKHPPLRDLPGRSKTDKAPEVLEDLRWQASLLCCLLPT